MKRTSTLSLALAAFAVTALFFGATAFAQTADEATAPPVQHGPNFIDENGDGFNDLAPDIDGDGIPNGQDADYVKPQDGSGQKKGRSLDRGAGNRAFGNGTCDGTGTGTQVRRADKGGFGSRGNGKGRTSK